MSAVSTQAQLDAASEGLRQSMDDLTTTALRIKADRDALAAAVRAYLALVDGQLDVTPERVTAMTAQMRAALARCE